MSQGRLWNERTRVLLTLELAVMLPAAALIGYSTWKLRSIQRDKAVDAAIERDFSHMLKVAEKRIDSRIVESVSEVRKKFPSPDACVPTVLDQILLAHPEIAHVFVYDSQTGLTFRSQPLRNGEPDFRAEGDDLNRMVNTWIKSEAPSLMERLQKSSEKGGSPQYYFFGNSVPRGQMKSYQNVALLTLPKVPAGHVALGGVAFDSEYLKDKFFPEMFDKLLVQDINDSQDGQKNPNIAVLMVRMKKDNWPMAQSRDWDGGKPEVERNFDDVFPGLTLGIKYRGTTVEAMSHRFIMTSFLIIGCLSLFLAVGILFTYRNIYRELALARLKSDFVANVSHELRTPLALIRLYAETLELGRLSTAEKYQEYYRTIRKESERLTGLINNILDFSRIEAGKKEYSFRETDLGELVRNTLDAYRFQIEQNGFQYEENISPDLPPVRVDREAIARSLLNLVNNAIKYSEHEKYVGVKLYRSNGNVNLEVIDRGIGIPRTEQSKIFEKFYRVGNPLVHNTKGSGLGLSLVRHIALAHGGDVQVESSPGHGSKFTFTLPIVSAHQELERRRL
ncbi:MAG: sensor histidine kinase [Deltaproteobacteria bacterium]